MGYEGSKLWTMVVSSSGRGRIYDVGDGAAGD